MSLEEEFFLRNSLRLEEKKGRFAEFVEILSQDTPTASNLEAQVAAYLTSSSKRMLQLLDDSEFLMKEGRLLSASMAARGVIETAGMLAEFMRKFGSALRRMDSAGAISLIHNFTFASMEFGANHSIATPHVMNGIRTLDKRCRGVENAYNALCETVHPNWAGRIAISGDAISENPGVRRIYVAVFFLGEVLECSANLCRDFKDDLSSQRKRVRDLLVAPREDTRRS